MERYGPNRLPEAPPRGPLMRLLAQFHNLLIYVLLGAALIAGAMGHWVDNIVVLGKLLSSTSRKLRLSLYWQQRPLF
jgi:magnesium-transporting ATPase (P-type)